jgi:DNA-binding IclR family transcriptional regulator
MSREFIPSSGTLGESTVGRSAAIVPASERGTESADRVADVLLLFARSEHPLGVSRVARELSLSKAVVHRILQSLTSRSLLQALPGGLAYALGPAAISLSTRVWSQLDVRTLAFPVLHRLRDATRETTTVSVLVGHHRIYLDQLESPQEVKTTVGIGPDYPLHSGASSRAILAYLPQAYIDEAVRQLQIAKPDIHPDDFLARLEEVRTHGFAVSMNERGTGTASIAAPFFDTQRNPVGSISASGPMFRFGEQEIASHTPHVVAAANELTALVAGDV